MNHRRPSVNALFFWAALFAPNRALTLGYNRFGETNVAALAGALPALAFVVVAFIAFVRIVRRAFSKGGRSSGQ